MKLAIAVLVLVVVLIVPSEAENCRSKPDLCKEDECCIEIGLTGGRCGPIRKEGDLCLLNSIHPSKEKDTYMMMCACGDGLTCEENENGIKPLFGRCAKK